jgi:hypothetical protein
VTILIGVIVDAVCAKLHNPTGRTLRDGAPTPGSFCRRARHAASHSKVSRRRRRRAAFHRASGTAAKKSPAGAGPRYPSRPGESSMGHATRLGYPAAVAVRKAPVAAVSNTREMRTARVAR